MRSLRFVTVPLVLTTSLALADDVDFNRDIRPILSERCFQCHGPDAGQRKGDLRLDTKVGLLGKSAGQGVVIAKHPGKSELLKRLTSKDADLRMPPPKAGKPLTAKQIALVKRWIEQGAEWKGHWAYLKVNKPTPPTVGKSAFVRNDIDKFILARMRSAPGGLSPAPTADRRTLIRRLKFDLLGLPPTPKEVADFLNDKRPDAYERLVDRFLKSPHFGERMAMYWLDVVRYADTNGIHGDNHRDIWLYRDYVIRSFNNNKRFDQFTREQLAGDLIKSPPLAKGGTKGGSQTAIDRKIASGYNRLLMTTREGGAQAKEYRAKYAADRVRNTSIAWLGSTMGCAECHDHKYDPFTAKDFYSFAAFFADIKETAVGKQPPNLRVPLAEQKKEIAKIDRRLAAIEKERRALRPKLKSAQRKWEAAMLAKLKSGANDWSIVTPAAVKSSGRSMLRVQKDGSVLSTGRNPAKDTYTVTLKSNQQTISAIRLEALTHPSLKNGLSRDNGNFVLTRFEVSVISKPGAKPQPVKLARAFADFSQPGFPVKNAIDGKANTGWAVEGHVRKGQSRTAVFVFDKPVKAGAKSIFTIRLRHESQYRRHNIGRFRLSLTSAKKPSLKGGLPANVVAALKIPVTKRPAKTQAVIDRYFESIAPEFAKLRKETASLKQKRTALEKNAPTTLISEAMATPRTVRILPRGNWLDDSGQIVKPAAPGFLKGIASKDKRLTRLDLANWIASKNNPLTARVFVNRLWKLYFGRGIVRSVDDFGAQGTWPTHPRLLDWLAADFVDNGWDVKRTIKQIVMSGTYQQSSSPKARRPRATGSDGTQPVGFDPSNKWFARQGRFRLDAELVRDNALYVSGLLVNKIGGKSVKPYQPIGYWAHLNFPRRSWKHDTGDAQYRRGLYTYWCRTFLHPSLLAFDAPSREECAVERPRSNTPLQALVLLNDPTYVEASRALAERVLREGGKTTESRLRFVFNVVLQRQPRKLESQVLSALAAQHLADYRKDEKAAQELLNVGLKPAPKDLNAAELAAWTSVSRVLLNLHETITRY